MSATTNRCKARTETGTPCPHPGKGQREDRWLCLGHVKTYDAHGGAPKHWRWPKPKVFAVVAALEDEPESNAFLDDTAPPVWVDPEAGFSYPEEAPHEDGLYLDPLDEQEQLDEPPPLTWVWWLALGVACVLLAFVIGLATGRATADDGVGPTEPVPSEPVRLATTPAPWPTPALFGTEAASKGADVDLYNAAAVLGAAAQSVGPGDAAPSGDEATSSYSDLGPAFTDDGSCYGVLPDYVVDRESGGNPQAVNPSSGAAGCFQFLPSTWAGYGGYASAADAPVSVQRERAAQLWADGDGCSHWSACGSSGGVPSAAPPLPLPSAPVESVYWYWWWVSW